MKSVMSVLVAAALLALSGGTAFGQGKAAQEAAHERTRLGIVALKQQTVVSTDPAKNILTVRGNDGSEQEIPLSGATRIKKGKTEISLSGVAAGEAVTVYFKKAKDGKSEPSTVKIIKPKNNLSYAD